MAALTLAQMAQTEEGKLRKGIYKGLYMQSLVADLLTFKDTGGVLSIGGLREDEVIQPDWTALDDSINSKTANVKPIRWSTYQMLVHLDIPEAIHENGGDQISGAKSYMVQSRAALKGAGLEMNDVFVNGDQAVDPNQPEGLNKLVHQLGSGQRVGATEIDVSDGGTVDEQYAVVDRLLEAHSMEQRGQADARVHEPHDGEPAAEHLPAEQNAGGPPQLGEGHVPGWRQPGDVLEPGDAADVHLRRRSVLRPWQQGRPDHSGDRQRLRGGRERRRDADIPHPPG